MYFLVAIYSYNPCTRQFHSDPPVVTSGDEPHYLIMISSLVMDGDLNLGNNYESARRGGFDAGRRRVARNLDHHTLVIDRRTGETALWASMFGLENEPCEPAEDCTGYNRVTNRFPDYTPNNPNFAERPWHSVPFPALLALLLSGSRQETFEARAIYLVVLMSWLAGLVTYACCLKLGLGRNWSLAAVAVLLFASPWFVYSHGLFAMTFLGLLLISALLALLYERFTIAAVLITIASMQSEAFVIIIPAWVVYLYFMKQKRAALTLAIAGIASVVVASLMNRLLLGKVSLRGMWFHFSPVLWKVFVEPQSGVLLFFPWCLVVFLFLGVLLLRFNRNRQRQVMLIAAGFLPMAAIYMFMPDTGGSGYGPRYWVPHLPWLSILFATAAKEYWNFKPFLLRPILLVLIVISTGIATLAAVVNRSEKLFWVKPPWYAAKLFLFRDDPSYRELLCPEGSTILLGIGCDKTATERGSITPPEAVRATALEVVSRLACATHIAEGTEVLRVSVFDDQGQSETFSMVAGRDSSEWSYDCQATRMAVRHSRAQVVASYAAGLNKEKCEGHRYLATLRFSKTANIQKLQFEWVGGEAAIILDRLTLKDETTGETFSIDAALFKP